jgi:hypothetical protein
MSKKILLLSARDSSGGAADWMFNTARILYEKKFSIALAVSEKFKSDDFIFQIPHIPKRKITIKRIFDYILSKLSSNKRPLLKTKPEYAFFHGEDETKTYRTPHEILSKLPFVPEIILVGQTYQFISFNTLKALHEITKASVYLVVLDMFFFTGGCHVINECQGYIINCNNCPGILSGDPKYALKNLSIKSKIAEDGKFEVLYGSGWGLLHANSSVVTKISKRFSWVAQ